MHELSLIQDLFVVWISALVAGQICQRLKMPAIAGYMLAGIAVGPHCLKLCSDLGQIQVLAEFGVAMLLFALGVDLSLKQLTSSAGKLVMTGTSQIAVTALAAAVIAMLLGLTKGGGQAFLFGCVCAISSSVIISKTLYDRGETDSVHGRVLIAISILQDLSLVLIIPFLPILANSPNVGTGDLLISAAKALGFIVFIVFGAVRILPPLLASSARTNNRELFLLTLLAICLAIALLSHQMGLSIALGAFLAGLMISESVYAHQALHDVQPLKDLFSVVFFVSVGMLLEPTFIFQHWLDVLSFVALLIAGKAAIGALSALFTTKNVRSAVMVGLGLAQIGEFSFVLLTVGRSLGLVSDYLYNLFFAGAVVSLIASPSLIALAPPIVHWFGKLKVQRSKGAAKAEPKSDEEKEKARQNQKDHVIICGFGRVGRNLGTVLSAYDIPYLVIELNHGVIDDLSERGIPALYGDATSQLLMVKANLKDAACIILTMPDPSAIMAITRFVRSRNKDVKIIARAHRQADIQAFTEAGVSAIVQPEFEASIEITRLALNSRKRQPEEIEVALDRIRAMRYPSTDPNDTELARADRFAMYLNLDEEQLGHWFDIETDKMSGKSARDLNIRGQTGVTIAAVKREEKTISYPPPDMTLSAGDQIYAVGRAEQLTKFEEFFGVKKVQRQALA